MFYYCTSLEKVELSNFNTFNLTDISAMFCFCSSLKELNISNFIITNIIYINALFSYCSSLVTLELPNFNIKNDEKEIDYMIESCPLLKNHKEIKNKFLCVDDTLCLCF